MTDFVAQTIARLPRPLRRHATQLPAEHARRSTSAPAEFLFAIGADQGARAQLRQRNGQVVDVRNFVAGNACDRRAPRASGPRSLRDRPAVAAPTRTCLRRTFRRSARLPSSRSCFPSAPTTPETSARVHRPHRPSSDAATRRPVRAVSITPDRAPPPTSAYGRLRCDVRLRRARAPRTIRWPDAQPRCLRPTP